MNAGYTARIWGGDRLTKRQVNWHFEVYSPDGLVVAMDNTGDWRKIYDNARKLVDVFNECETRGITIKQPKWIKEIVGKHNSKRGEQ